jgi:RNA polymerase primary sigma factor
MASDDTITKGNGKDGGGDDAPLIDLNEATIKKLIAKAKRKGYITYDELNAALPQDELSSEQIEDVMSAISEMGVNIVESDEDAQEEDEEASDGPDELTPDSGDDDEDEGPKHVPEKKKAATTERTDDPVRMYRARWARSSCSAARARSPSPSASRPAATR